MVVVVVSITGGVRSKSTVDSSSVGRCKSNGHELKRPQP